VPSSRWILTSGFILGLSNKSDMAEYVWHDGGFFGQIDETYAAKRLVGPFAPVIEVERPPPSNLRNFGNIR